MRQTSRRVAAAGQFLRASRPSPAGRPYFWNIFRPIDDDAEGTDIWAFFHGFIAVTPMTLDVTSPALEAFPVLNLP